MKAFLPPVREIFESEHRDFGESVAAFLRRAADPNYLDWEAAGQVPHEVFEEAGSNGFLAFDAPEAYGGAGITDFRFNAMLSEQCYARGYSGLAAGMTLHNDIVVPYFLEYATAEQRERWLPGLVSGQLVGAIAMTEPGTGSDLGGIATKAIRRDESFVVNGGKTFVTNGLNADLVIVAVRTSSDRRAGLSLIVVERGTTGFERGRKLEKIGLRSQDTAELFFDDLRVPRENLLGEEGLGFSYLASNLPRERLSIAVAALGSARAAVQWTLDYVKGREAFGRRLSEFQNTKFELATASTATEVTQAYVDQCIGRLNGGNLTPADAARAKWWATDVQGQVVDRCLQMFGGYGYMRDYPIGRAFVDARVTRIYGGSNEIMKDIVARSLGL